MSAVSLLNHLINFVAPAFGVGFLLALVALVGRIRSRQAAKGMAWWVQGTINFLVGVVVLVGGLLLFDRDGKMATYAALVLACGTSQCLLSGAWRRA